MTSAENGEFLWALVALFKEKCFSLIKPIGSFESHASELGTLNKRDKILYLTVWDLLLEIAYC